MAKNKANRNKESRIHITDVQDTLGNTLIEKTVVRNVIYTTDKEAQYDKEAKEIMGNKNILAWLLVNTVGEFYGMEPEEAAAYIEGDPYVGIVPVEPGMTNAAEQKNGEKITGLNTENFEKNEGLICFDIMFFVRTRDGKSRIIVDVEIQKDEPTAYHILNRAVFYVGRQISAQKDREFIKSQYNDLKKVYGIWICLNQKKDTLQHIQFNKKELIGEQTWKGEMEIPNIIMLGLSKELPEPKEGKTLHRLLGILFSNTMDADEKISILENEYHIPMEEKSREGLNIMCNLGQGIRERAIAEGRIAGRLEGERIGERRGEKRGEDRGRRIGEELGEERGRRTGEERSMKLIQILMSSNRMEECQRVIQDESYRRQLMKELGI